MIAAEVAVAALKELGYDVWWTPDTTDEPDGWLLHRRDWSVPVDDITRAIALGHVAAGEPDWPMACRLHQEPDDECRWLPAHVLAKDPTTTCEGETP